MFVLVFLAILLSNYIIVANISENGKIIYFTVLTIIIILSIVLSIL
jgi:hypothetical protein